MHVKVQTFRSRLHAKMPSSHLSNNANPHWSRFGELHGVIVAATDLRNLFQALPHRLQCLYFPYRPFVKISGVVKLQRRHLLNKKQLNTKASFPITLRVALCYDDSPGYCSLCNATNSNNKLSYRRNSTRCGHSMPSVVVPIDAAYSLWPHISTQL